MSHLYKLLIGSVPTAPTGLTTDEITFEHVELSWTTTPNAISYIIYRDSSQIGTSSTTTFDDTTVSPSTAYSYQLRAVNGAGQSALSSALQVSVPAQSSALISVNFNTAPSVAGNGGIYTGSVGSLTLDVRNGTSTKYEHITGAEAYGGSGGCAKFYGSTDGGGCYRGLIPSMSGISTRMNMRYLNKWNTAFVNSGGYKADYMTLGGSPFWSQPKALASVYGTGMQQTLSYQGTLYIIHGNGQSCANIEGSGYEGALCNGTDSGIGSGVPGPFLYSSYVNQWVCFEHEVHSSGIYRQYIWTQDEAFSGLYMEYTAMPLSGSISVDGCGGMYFHDQGASYSGAALYVDEFVMGTSLIGPPAGF